MGFTCWRYISAKNEIINFPAIRNDLGSKSAWKPSRFKEIELHVISVKKPIYITPYTLGGMEQQSKIRLDGKGYEKNAINTFQTGLDSKYGLSSNYTVDITINPDFAQHRSR